MAARKNTSSTGSGAEPASMLWHKRGTFVLAAAASAIGLGNIWRFPYELGENGGGAFLMVYLLCIGVICVPIMMAETLIGRVGREGPVQAFLNIAEKQKYGLGGGGMYWALVGLLGTFTAFLLASYYGVVGGWTVGYTLDALTITGSAGTLEEAQGLFATLTGSATSTPGFLGLLVDNYIEILMMTLFLGASAFVVYQGVVAGLERFLRIVLPLLLIIMLATTVYSLIIGEAEKALSYIFLPDFSKLSPEVVLKAMGHAFFSLSLGMGVLITFGGYTPSEQSLSKTVLTVAALDTLVAICAGVMIFPMIFAIEGLSVNAGPSLVFHSMPTVFAQMPMGSLVQIAFFSLLMLAAMSSMVSIIEPAVSVLENRVKIGRQTATLVISAVLWVLAVGCSFFGAMFGLFDYLTANVLLPIGGILISIYVGWVLMPSTYIDQKGMPSGDMHQVWILIVRWLAPLVITAILINGLLFS